MQQTKGSVNVLMLFIEAGFVGLRIPFQFQGESITGSSGTLVPINIGHPTSKDYKRVKMEEGVVALQNPLINF
jgi:hypothetical protein